MNHLIEIIGIASFSWLFAEGSGIVQWMKWRIQQYKWKKELPLKAAKRLKPFDCPLCLSFWLGLIYFGLTLHTWQCIFYASICSVLAVIISKLTKI